MAKMIPLGKSNIQISPLGIGTWQWGDRLIWAYKNTHTDEDIQAAFQASLQGGVNWFDTAEVYGRGVSERLVGNALRSTSQPVLVASKFFPFPWRLTKKQLQSALKGSLERLGVPCVDLYQIHWPFPPVPVETWADALAEAVHAGLARSVGVSNYNLEQMQRTEKVLNQHGVPLASNQVHYSLLNRRVERSGLLDYCIKNEITLIAYSPLEKGMLSGKYSSQNLPAGARRRMYTAAYMKKNEPVLQLVSQLARSYGKTPSQVALNWVICKGAVPIPGAKNARQAEDDVGALGWQLTPGEIAALDQVSDVLSDAGG